MSALDDLDVNIAAAEVVAGMAVLNPGMAGLDDPPCCSTVINVVHVGHDDDGMVTFTGACGHPTRMNSRMRITPFTQAIGDLFGTIVIDEAERLGINRT